MPTTNDYLCQSYLSQARSRLGLALVELYAMNEEDNSLICTRYHANYAEFFRACMLGKAGYNPVPNKAQERLADFPGETMSLYVGVFDCYQPSHYLTLARNSEGLWQLKKPSVRAVGSSVKAGMFAMVTLNRFGGGVRGWLRVNGCKSTV